MKQLAVGVMSGTSGDGVSVALAGFDKHSFHLVDYKTFSYPPKIESEIAHASELTTPRLSRLNMVLGEFFAHAVSRFLSPHRNVRARIKVIGSHGHTVYHGPEDRPANTLQIGEPSVIAERIGIPVVADFRMRHVAAGGEGAPLIPFFDQFFYGEGPVRALQNIGGIGNVTVVGKSIAPLYFDTGPGNCLIDLTVKQFTRGRKTYDRGGAIARQGRVNMHAVDLMIRHPYFKKRPPKSTGRELFNASFIPTALRKERFENIVATLTYFTARTVYESYRRFIPHPIHEIIVSGGGALNDTLMKHLATFFAPTAVTSIASDGIPAQAKEPVAFAFFALRALNGECNALAPGKRKSGMRPLILGKIIPAINRPKVLSSVA